MEHMSYFQRDMKIIHLSIFWKEPSILLKLGNRRPAPEFILSVHVFFCLLLYHGALQVKAKQLLRIRRLGFINLRPYLGRTTRQ